MKHFLSLFIAILSGFGCLAQTKSSVIDNVLNKYCTESSFEYKTTYNLYKTHTSSTIVESNKGIYRRSGRSQFYFKYDNMELFIEPKIVLQIDHNQKTMAVGKNDGNMPDKFDIKQTLKGFKVTEEKKVKDGWRLTLQTGNNPTGFPYSKIVLYITVDYTIQRQIFFYDGEIDFSDAFDKNDFNTPRLEVVYVRSKTPVKLSGLKLDKYFVVKNHKAYPTELYNNYSITDNRR